MFKKYQSIPKIIEAVQFRDDNKDCIFNSLTGQYAADFENGNPILKITTSHGDIAIVRLGDWIVKDIKEGTYYPVKNEIFIKSYKPI